MAFTEHRQPDGPPPPYMRFEIDAVLVDDDGKVIDSWQDIQELWVGPPNIAVRRTRTLPGGKTLTYEDRGTLDETMRISGKDGFGGTWSGRFLETGVLHTQGSGGKSSFHMTNWTFTQGEQACLRVLDVNEPVAFLTEQPLAPGRYYVHTEDHLREVSGDVPDSLKRPLS